MAQKKSGQVSWSTAEGWEVHSAGAVRGGRRAAAELPDPFVAHLTATSRWRSNRPSWRPRSLAEVRQPRRR